MKRLLFPLGLALGLALAGHPASAAAEPVPGTNTVAVAATTNAPAAASGTNTTAKASKESQATGPVDPETRELKPHDVMRFQIEEDPPLAQGAEPMHVSISDGGEALFPVSRHADTYVKVAAAGRKLADLRKDVKALLDADYYNDSTVKLDLEYVYRNSTGFGSDQAKVTIYGTLNQVLPIGEGETLMLSDAILRVGGGQSGSFVNLEKVRIHRLDPNTKLERTITVNVDEVLHKGARQRDQQLQDGDRIEVRDKTFNLFN